MPVRTKLYGKTFAHVVKFEKAFRRYRYSPDTHEKIKERTKAQETGEHRPKLPTDAGIPRSRHAPLREN